MIGGSLTQVSQMLDQSIEELFVPYMEGTRYLEKEGKSLTELYAGRLIRFTNWHVSRLASLLSLALVLSLSERKDLTREVQLVEGNEQSEIWKHDFRSDGYSTFECGSSSTPLFFSINDKSLQYRWRIIDVTTSDSRSGARFFSSRSVDEVLWTIEYCREGLFFLFPHNRFSRGRRIRDDRRRRRSVEDV